MTFLDMRYSHTNIILIVTLHFYFCNLAIRMGSWYGTLSCVCSNPKRGCASHSYCFNCGNLLYWTCCCSMTVSSNKEDFHRSNCNTWRDAFQEGLRNTLNGNNQTTITPIVIIATTEPPPQPTIQKSIKKNNRRSSYLLRSGKKNQPLH